MWIHIMCVSIRTMDASDSDGVSEDEGLFQNPPAHVRGSLRSLHADLIALAGPHPSHAPVGVAAKTLGAKAGCMGAAAKSLLVQRTSSLFKATGRGAGARGGSARGAGGGGGKGGVKSSAGYTATAGAAMTGAQGTKLPYIAT